MWRLQTATMLRQTRFVRDAVALQVLWQALAFATGILIVRILTVEEYALFTLAIAALGAAGTLSDSGIVHAVMARAGRVWQQRESLGAVLAGGMAIRRKATIISLALVCPGLALLVLRQEGSYDDALLLGAVIIPVLATTSVSALLEIPLRLHQQIRILQLAQITMEGLRFPAVAVALVLHPAAWLAVLASVGPQVYFNSLLRLRIRELSDMDAQPDPDARAGILAQVLRSLPGTLYYVFAGQLSVVLISLFGTTAGVAQVGALGRLALIAAFILTIFRLLAVPRYARISNHDAGTLLHRYVFFLFLVGACCGAVVLVAWIMPGSLLFILGSQYELLEQELVLAIAAGAMATVAGAAGALAAVRGIVVSPFISLPAGVAVQIALIASLPLDEVRSMFWIAFSLAATQTLVSIVNFLFWLTRDSRTQSDPPVTQ